tara:strand:- start:108 stop:329 length:222 start_codon:yes stop_codon:yes gene_type:complete
MFHAIKTQVFIHLLIQTLEDLLPLKTKIELICLFPLRHMGFLSYRYLYFVTNFKDRPTRGTPAFPFTLTISVL